MSKQSKLKNREKRLQEKRSRKAANKASYAEWKRLGINGKSKRFNKSKRKLAKTIEHKDGPCGNLACKLCFPTVLIDVWIAKLDERIAKHSETINLTLH